MRSVINMNDYPYTWAISTGTVLFLTIRDVAVHGSGLNFLFVLVGILLVYFAPRTKWQWSLTAAGLALFAVNHFALQ